MNETATNKPSFSRFTKYIFIGAALGGVLSALPLINILNCLYCCILNMAGVGFALNLYLKANPADNIANAESAIFGAIAGAGAGVIFTILNAIFMAIVGWPTTVAINYITHIIYGGGFYYPVLSMISNIIIYGGFGALGAFLWMQFFAKGRIRKG